MNAREITHIAVTEFGDPKRPSLGGTRLSIVATCTDGSIWAWTSVRGWWERIPDLPGIDDLDPMRKESQA